MTADKILDKLSKLKAAQEGEAKLGNAAAAEAFAEMINRMLIQHELSAVDIPVGGVKDDPIVELLVDSKVHGIKFSSRRIGWQEALARIVGEAHLCKFLVRTGTNYITFVGTKSHATVAEYAYGVLVASADRMSIEARAEWWRTECGGKHLESGNFRAAWINGFVGRIAERFRDARMAEVKAATDSSTALVRLSNALTRAQEHIKAKHKGKAASTQMASGCYEGRMAGRAAADRVALGRKGVEGKQGLLK